MPRPECTVPPSPSASYMGLGQVPHSSNMPVNKTHQSAEVRQHSIQAQKSILASLLSS